MSDLPPERPPALFREPPCSDEIVRVTPCGASSEQGEPAAPHHEVRFLLWRDVLEALAREAQRDQATPRLGLLTGYCGLGRRGAFLEITGFEALVPTEGVSEAEQTARLHEALERLSGLGATEHYDADALGGLGLVALEPGGGAGLSDLMIRLHLSLCNVPYQIALILDVASDAVALYTRRPGSAFYNVPFELIAEREAATRSA